MSYIHPPFPYSDNVALPLEQTIGYGVPTRHPHMEPPMDTYLIPHAPEFYHHHPAFEDYDEYAENLTRPRLTKEQVDTLEAQFQAHPKPNGNIKRQLAAQTNLTLPRVANWFQNRRAKAKQQRRQEEYERMQAKKNSEKSESDENSRPADSQEEPSEQGDSSSTPAQDATVSGSSSCSVTASSPAPAGDSERKCNSTSRTSSFESLQKAVNSAVSSRLQNNHNEAESTPKISQEMKPQSEALQASANQNVDNCLQPAFQEGEVNVPRAENWDPSASALKGVDYNNMSHQGQGQQHIPLELCVSNPETQSMSLAEAQFSNFEYQGQLDGWDNPADTAHPLRCTTASFQPVPFTTLCSPVFSDERRGSCTSNHSDMSDSFAGHSSSQFSQVQNNFHNMQQNAGWRRPEKELDLAARRKRPRPAAIGTTGLNRTYIGPSSMSPTTRLNFGPGHALRHAKSAQTLSPGLSPRYSGVRKVSATQRSPLGMSTFAEASLLNASNNPENAMAVPPLVTTTMAPPTPLTPEDLQHLLPPTPSDNQYCLSPTEDMGCSQFYQMSQPMQLHVGSPPATPLNMEVMSQFQCQSYSQPSSAPSQFTTFQDYTIPLPTAPMNAGLWHDTPALSSPEHGSQQQTLHMPQPTHISPITYEEPLQNMAGHACSVDDQGQSPRFTLKVSGTPPSADDSVSASQKITEFRIQEFPKQEEAHRHAAQLLPPQKHKTYTFANHTANDF